MQQQAPPDASAQAQKLQALMFLLAAYPLPRDQNEEGWLKAQLAYAEDIPPSLYAQACLNLGRRWGVNPKDGYEHMSPPPPRPGHIRSEVDRLAANQRRLERERQKQAEWEDFRAKCLTPEQAAAELEAALSEGRPEDPFQAVAHEFWISGLRTCIANGGVKALPEDFAEAEERMEAARDLECQACDRGGEQA